MGVGMLSGKEFLGFLVFGLFVSWFQSFLVPNCLSFEDLPHFHFMLLINIDPIFKIFKICVDGSSSFVGARLFQKLEHQNSEVYKHNISKKCL